MDLAHLGESYQSSYELPNFLIGVGLFSKGLPSE